MLELTFSHILIELSKYKLTFLLFGLLVTNREADRDSSVENVAVSITAMIQKCSKGLTSLV